MRSNTKDTFFAIGEDMAWWDNGIHDYDKCVSFISSAPLSHPLTSLLPCLLIYLFSWVGRLAASGANYFRLWIGATDFGFAVEEKLGDYSSTQEKGKMEG